MARRIDLDDIEQLDGWMSLPEVAEALGYSRQYVHSLAASERFSSIRRIGTYLIVSSDEVYEICHSGVDNEKRREVEY